MKFRDEYRDSEAARRMVDAIARTVTRPWTLMEVCGGQTHSIVRFGIDQLLPDTITLLHGPGCPVCVTPVTYIDKAIEIASRPGVILCSFGDMMRVPGTHGSLLTAKSHGVGGRRRLKTNCEEHNLALRFGASHLECLGRRVDDPYISTA